MTTGKLIIKHVSKITLLSLLIIIILVYSYSTDQSIDSTTVFEGKIEKVLKSNSDEAKLIVKTTEGTQIRCFINLKENKLKSKYVESKIDVFDQANNHKFELKTKHQLNLRSKVQKRKTICTKLITAHLCLTKHKEPKKRLKRRFYLLLFFLECFSKIF